MLLLQKGRKSPKKEGLVLVASGLDSLSSLILGNPCFHFLVHFPFAVFDFLCSILIGCLMYLTASLLQHWKQLWILINYKTLKSFSQLLKNLKVNNCFPLLHESNFHFLVYSLFLITWICLLAASHFFPPSFLVSFILLSSFHGCMFILQMPKKKYKNRRVSSHLI